MGYAAGVRAYQRAVAELSVADLSEHYTRGLGFFSERFVPHLAARLEALSGGQWALGEFRAFAAGSDVDLMTHLVEAVAAAGERVCLYPGDWYGFRQGATRLEQVHWDPTGRGALACLCVPSVRNGHVTDEMLAFLAGARACLLNLNLYPTLPASERHAVAAALRPLLDRAVLSISFSRGFGLTASQLGVILVHRDHPFCQRFETQWEWLSYFYNALAARAFMALPVGELERVDAQRRSWVLAWLRERGLPTVESGSYYVKSFRVDGAVSERLRPLVRGDVVRLCFKPPQTA